MKSNFSTLPKVHDFSMRNKQTLVSAKYFDICRRYLKMRQLNFFSKQPLKATQFLVLQRILHLQYLKHLIGLMSACLKRNQKTINSQI